MSKIIECRKVVKVFKDAHREVRVLRGVDMDVYEGEALAISGASGAGKSTLLQIVGTLDRPTSGEVLFREKALSMLGRAGTNRVRNEQIGFVFQFYHLLPEFTALENVMMPGLCLGKSKRQLNGRAVELLEKVGLKERMTHKPGQLSGGEQQRVAIARAIYNKPAVVLADEPTGNLDEITGVGIVDLLFELNASEGVTLVLVTHDMGLAKRANRWIHLHEGVAETRTA